MVDIRLLKTMSDGELTKLLQIAIEMRSKYIRIIKEEMNRRIKCA